MSLQPDAAAAIDRNEVAPFLLRLFWRQGRQLEASEFSFAPPEDTEEITDYSALLPQEIRTKSFQIYTWPSCTLAELSMLVCTNLPDGVLPEPAVGTRLVYKLIFPDTRAEVEPDGRGKWIDKPLGSVIIGGRDADLDDKDGETNATLEGDSEKLLSDARFVIGDYVACAIYPPGPDGRIAPLPSSRPRYPPGRENGYGGGGYGRGGGYRSGGYGGRGGFGTAPPPGDWRRGERLPGPPTQPFHGGPRSGRGGGGRPY